MAAAGNSGVVCPCCAGAGGVPVSWINLLMDWCSAYLREVLLLLANKSVDHLVEKMFRVEEGRENGCSSLPQHHATNVEQGQNSLYHIQHKDVDTGNGLGGKNSLKSSTASMTMR